MASADDKLTNETPENKWEAASNAIIQESLVIENDEKDYPTLKSIRGELKKNPEFNSKTVSHFLKNKLYLFKIELFNYKILLMILR